MSERRNNLLKSTVKKSAISTVDKLPKRTKHTISPRREKPPAISPNGIVVFDNESTTVEVTVKTKGKMSSPSVKNQSPMSVNKIEGRKSSEISIDSHSNWNKILREQNQSSLRQTMQHFVEKTPTSKTSRSNLSENRESKRSIESKKSFKHDSNNEKLLREIPLKHSSSQKKTHEHDKLPTMQNQSAMTIFNGIESVIVTDKSVQCGGIFDKSNESLGEFNPVRTLAFLMKEMESLINDERMSKILTQMEQALIRIPIDQCYQSDLVSIASKAKLEATTAKLAATSKSIGESYKTALKENTILQQHIQELSSRLKQSKQRQNELEYEIKNMRIELNTLVKSDSANKKIINDLKEKTKQIDVLEKVLIDKNSLEQLLTEERELLRQKELEIEYLKIEKAKLSDMSSFRNSQLIELRNSIKSLQNNIANQVANLRDIPQEDEFVSVPPYHSTVIEKEIPYSSPTRTLSNNSIAPISWHGVSELSNGNISNHNNERSRKRSGSRPQSRGPSVASHDSDVEKFAEKTHLEFTSIAGDQTLHSLNSAIIENADDDDYDNNEKFIDLQSVDEVDNSIIKENSSSDDGTTKKSEMTMRTHKRRKKSRTRSQLNKSYNNARSRSPSDNTLNPSENLFSTSSMYRDMKGQLQQMFEDMKMRGRMPVNIPEPPRKFPNPEWTDSSLPTMSISESNLI
ncbi:hypothetical protein PV325_009222 [Microctonus aethiopoides]|uniref:Uncharacterized protein n=1 Tax=Microctonus aethiopoides TaxID=144406 RepID=A0AA39F6J5_9HYME|nr:hypothetical protein PV325_009222 [Microctonus aethiopoides]KAK0163850.1 hypothetical protein PV328_002539 [Microctonus aethiopoides]